MGIVCCLDWRDFQMIFGWIVIISKYFPPKMPAGGIAIFQSWILPFHIYKYVMSSSPTFANTACNLWAGQLVSYATQSLVSCQGLIKWSMWSVIGPRISKQWNHETIFSFQYVTPFQCTLERMRCLSWFWSCALTMAFSHFINTPSATRKHANEAGSSLQDDHTPTITQHADDVEPLLRKVLSISENKIPRNWPQDLETSVSFQLQFLMRYSTHT